MTISIAEKSAKALRDSRKPVTVLGASGFVGSHLMAYIKTLGLEAKTPLKGDESIFNQDLGHVFYCIGLTADYSQRPLDTVEAHSSLLARLFRVNRFDSLVYLSSTRLYDSAESGREDADIRLNPGNPRHVYDLSKMLGEWMCLNASHGKARVVRLSSVYSHDLADRNFLHTTVERALLGKNFSLDTATDLARDYVYVDDVCAAMLAIAVGGRHKLYNLASGENIRNADLFAMTRKYSGVEIKAEKPEAKIKSPQVDISRLRDDFGFQPSLLADKIKFIIESNSKQPPKSHAAS